MKGSLKRNKTIDISYVWNQWTVANDGATFITCKALKVFLSEGRSFVFICKEFTWMNGRRVWKYVDQVDREQWWCLAGKGVWICASAAPDFSMRTPLISPRKNLNDRRSLPPSETNGGMDWFSAQPCKFATSRVNLQISSFFSARVSRTHRQEAQQHRKRRFWQVSRFLTDFEKLQEFSNGDCCGLSDDGDVSLGNAEPWLTFNFPQIHFVCFLSSGSSLRGVFFITKQLVFSYLSFSHSFFIQRAHIFFSGFQAWMAE